MNIKCSSLCEKDISDFVFVPSFNIQEFWKKSALKPSFYAKIKSDE